MKKEQSFLPMTPDEVKARKWDEVDIILVTGDAYVDHPSFAIAVVGRVLEAAGFRVAVLAQPEWQSCEPWRRFGKPRLFFGVTAGNVDSMINRYTANKKIRNNDDYSSGGRAGLRPDRATIVYTQRAKEAYPGVMVIAGGVEASMRRLAHYDYWSDKVRKSVLLDAKADLLIYGMGEAAVVEVARLVAKGKQLGDLRQVRGTVYSLGRREQLEVPDQVVLPSFEEVSKDPVKFMEAARIIYAETNPCNAKPLTQVHGDRVIIQNPPALPLSTLELDRIYELPFKRLPHPSYKEKIPAFEMIRDSIMIHRGCFGGCSFCSLTLHQGRIIQSRSRISILNEVKKIAAGRNFKGVISDLGGPTANMYGMRCKNEKAKLKCRELSCLYPRICRNLDTDCSHLLQLLTESSQVPGIKQVFIASGVRMDLALLSDEYMTRLAGEHTGGHLKVAPEHVTPEVLKLMKKPGISVFLKFRDVFDKASRKAGKKQYLVPYFISGFPVSDIKSMVDVALFLKDHNYRPLQVMDFIPAPMELATAAYHTKLDPVSLKLLHVPKGELERKLQRALLQCFKPENRPLVLKALRKIGRNDLVTSLLG